MSILKRLQKATSSAFFRDVAKLSFGTLAGKLVAIAALPLLTRIYSPDDFSLLAAYLALVSTVSVGACLRLELAIPLAESDEDADNLLALASFALGAVTAVGVALVVLIPNQITQQLNQPNLLPHLWLIPTGIASIGIYSISQNRATRGRRFNEIANTRITQAVFGTGTAVTLGLTGFGTIGLLLGNLLTTSAGGIKLAILSLRHKPLNISTYSKKSLLQALKKYKKYPIFSTPESLFNTAGAQLPILLISAYAGAEAGFFALAMQVMGTPMGLLGKAIAQVYISRAPQALVENTLHSFTRKIMLQLFKVGVLPIIALATLAPFTASFVFGSSWERAGEIIALLSPWMLLQFVASPVSIALHVTGHQARAMSFQVVGFLIRMSLILFAAKYSPDHMVEVHAFSGIVFYGLYIYLILSTTHISTAERPPSR